MGKNKFLEDLIENEEVKTDSNIFVDRKKTGGGRPLKGLKKDKEIRILVDEEQRAKLERVSEKSGLSVSLIIRNLIDTIEG